ncbi:uncharacterized protein LOC114374343 [Glycine soja]|uniref:uncharacterized protein LOC114374343 n=1 Tax=Glycine soja TaxID=3848 RepID=UPI00103EC455|nr:uncharacterized protein LOC114374343 [Glycine soja]
MVRIRGLGRALGHVIGKGDRDDFDYVAQRRRPTAFARRQQVPMTVAHDESVLPAPDVEADVFPDDPMAPADVEDTGADIPADTGAQAAEDEHEGFPGGPSDPSMLTQYTDHVACSERPELKLSSHGRKVHSLGKPAPAIEGLVVGTGLSPLRLLSSFVERWHRETSSFHLPVGEVTITLENVLSLLHLPVVGNLHAFQPLHVDDAVQMLVDLLMVSTEAVRAETGQCRGPYVRLQWSATNVHVVYLKALCDLSQTGRYAWGVAALCWIYEHFPSVAESTADQDYDEDSPRACSGGGLVAVYYRPERVMRQFGYTQTIPAPPVDSWVSYDDIHNRWMHYLDHMVPGGEVCVVPDGHAPQPQVIPQAPETDIPHVPEPRAPSTSARPAVEEPRHVVEVCYGIVERLECHLSLGVVTPGSSTHEVIEEFLWMARSVTQDQA